MRKCLYLLVLLLVMGCQQFSIGQDKLASEANEVSVQADTELKIYKSTLFEGKAEQIRIDAAAVLLFREEPAARKILLDALKQTENSDARAAVCKALSQTRSTGKPLKKKKDFVQPLLDILTMEENSVAARLAAEATLVFEYDQISEQLERTVTDTSLPAKARLNAVYALELHPDMRVAIKLITLLDDPERQVVRQRRKPCIFWGYRRAKMPKLASKPLLNSNNKVPRRSCGIY